MLLLAVLLTGCSNQLPRVTLVPLQVDDEGAISAAFAEWNRRQDLPNIEERPDLLVTDAEDAEVFHELCHACGPSRFEPVCNIRYGDPPTAVFRANSCIATRDRVYGPLGMFTPSNAWQLIVLFPQPLQPRVRYSLVVHEAIHWFESITGLGRDDHHRDPRRWTVPGSVEYNATH